jgi:hypothetical protein
MNEMNAQPESQEAEELGAAQQRATEQWETPMLEDVSEQVMAQPYIRFT